MEKVLVPKKKELKLFQVSKRDGKSFSSKNKKQNFFRFQNEMGKKF